MKKILGIVVLGLLLSTNAYSYSKGQGDLKLSSNVLTGFMQYLNFNAIHNKSQGADQRGTPSFFAVTQSGNTYGYSYCPRNQQCRPVPRVALQSCKSRTNEKCYVFAQGRKIVWNRVNYKFSRKATSSEIERILEELGFYGNTTTTKKIEKKEPKKVEKKKEKPKKVVKKYELKGERSIALSWEGYEDLIAGTVEFDETDYRGTLNLPLPNNDGTCDGTYSLQEGGKGTWQIACTNNMGAAGTLKWIKDGGVTGTGRDHNDKKVKFTVSKQS
jgi:hypothetical protein